MHEALWPKDLFEQGIGWVIVARFKSAGQRVEAGIFLVDVGCLGVKLAVYESGDRQDYLQRIRGHYESDFPMVSLEPECARQLVEQAAQYAHGLGFAPHPDYKKAARVFGGLNAGQCGRHFTFGREGKPFYCRGPRETEERPGASCGNWNGAVGSWELPLLVALGDARSVVSGISRPPAETPTL